VHGNVVKVSHLDCFAALLRASQLLAVARTARTVLTKPHPVNGKKRKMTQFTGGLRYVCKDSARRPCERSEAIQTIDNEGITESVIVNAVKQSRE
jgi:hypothetical protein